MIPIDDYLKDQPTKKGPTYSGWDSGMHRLPQTKNEDGSFSITYFGVKYTYSQILAADLERWHVLDPQSSRKSYPLVEKWYCQLTDIQKTQVKKENL